MTPFLSGIVAGASHLRTSILAIVFLLRSSVLLAVFALSVSQADAQVNSWTKPGSGNWEESVWSLGILPGAGQTVQITNAGWKAVAISASTAQNFPASLTVDRITVNSPTNTFNTLLLNYAGFQTPLATKWLTVSSNAAVTMFSSAIQFTGGGGEGLSLGGEFNQNDSSIVSGPHIDAGYSGPGVYNLNSGSASIGSVFLGGPFKGVFNQNAGSVSIGILHLDGGEYNFSGGDFSSMIYFNGGVFRQKNGSLSNVVEIFNGTFVLENGMFLGPMQVPSGNGSGLFLQTGGTNLGSSLRVGFNGNVPGGSYVLSNGVVRATVFEVQGRGHFIQQNGTHTVTGSLSLHGGFVNRGDISYAIYTLNGGLLTADSMNASWAFFTQSGGLCRIAGDVTVNPAYSGGITLNGGTFQCLNNSVGGSFSGGFVQNGGTHIVSNTLAVQPGGFYSPGYIIHGYTMAGGDLIVSNIVVSGVSFFDSGGAISQSGLLTLSDAILHESAVNRQFGSLLVNSVAAETNSIIILSTNSTVLRFQQSSHLDWDPNARLIVRNWTGSQFGEGAHQIYFGASTSGLSLSQLNQLLFENPAGFDPGVYPARILETGEIVPRPLSPTGGVPAFVFIQPQANHAMRIVLNGVVDGNYGIEVSSNLVDWIFWTNRTAVGGVMSVMDETAPAQSERYYRAVLLP